MKALVTGGAGFIGSHLCELLLSKGYEVTALDNLSCGNLKNIESIAGHSAFRFVESDIRKSENLCTEFEGVDWVFHLAGLADIVPSIERPSDYYQTNVTGTFNVLECARECGVKRFIYAASSSSYGIPQTYPTPETSAIKPQYPYALTKFLGEELVLHWSLTYQLPALSLRLFNVFGPRSRTSGTYGAVFGVFLAQKINNKPFTVVGDGSQTRDFTYVTDVAKAFLAAALSDHTGEAFNVGSGDHYSVNRLVEIIGGDVVFIPKRPGEPDCTFADIAKIKEYLHWNPEISFDVGVKNILARLGDWVDAPIWDPESIENATETWFKYLSRSNSHE